MAAIDKLDKASFAGIAFPYSKRDVTGGYRTHDHEYSHANGAKIEKLGRKPYRFKFSVPVRENMIGWKGIWPDLLSDLRTVFDLGRTAELVVPGIGPVPAVCLDWSQMLDTKKRCGEDVELTFEEDTSNDFLFDAVVAPSAEALLDVSEDLSAELQIALDELEIPTTPDLFSSIQSLTSDIASIRDQAEFFANDLSNKCDQLKALVETADDTLAFLQNPSPVVQPVIDGLRDLWDATDKLQRDVQGTAKTVGSYVVPFEMAIGDVATAIFGDASKGYELLGMNTVPDPLLIKPGSTISYYAES